MIPSDNFQFYVLNNIAIENDHASKSYRRLFVKIIAFDKRYNDMTR